VIRTLSRGSAFAEFLRRVLSNLYVVEGLK
jgi:hypothetical protein